MIYQVKLEAFEGPLDLLLHLINKNKINIEDISIAEITQQYVEYLNEMQRFDIEIASEFLVMAATLLYIKSCMLVPKNKTEQEDPTEDDPRQELIQRLIEYKRYKEVSFKLQKLELAHSHIFYKLPEEIIESSSDTITFYGIPKDELLKTIKMLIEKKEIPKKQPFIHRIKRDNISIKERSSEIRQIFKFKSEVYFFDLFKEDYSRSDVVITFLSLLELLKDGIVKLHQDSPFDNILIKRRDNTDG